MSETVAPAVPAELEGLIARLEDVQPVLASPIVRALISEAATALRALKGERDEAEIAKNRWVETHLAHRSACDALGKANGELFKRAYEAEHRTDALAIDNERLKGERLNCDRRIHNQRRALQENWQIVEQRAKNRHPGGAPLSEEVASRHLKRALAARRDRDAAIARAEAAETSLAAQEALVEEAGNVLRNVVNCIESGNLQMNSPNINGDERDGRDSPYPWHDEWIGYVRSFLAKLSGKETTPEKAEAQSPAAWRLGMYDDTEPKLSGKETTP